MTATLTYPSVEQFIDLFNWASPGLVVTTADGAVVIANKAASELLAAHAQTGANLPQALGINDYPLHRQAQVPVENLPAAFANAAFPAGFANVGFASVDGTDYAFWALRPVTSHPTPAPRRSDGTTTAEAWINAVNTANAAYTPADASHAPLIRALYDTCPVAIHLIETDGTVAFANWKDIEIVGASDNPTSYVGHHIRGIYADQPVVEDFLARWGEDAPIIDFRADFMDRSRNNERVPVVIFSTALVQDNKLENTRCFVFPDSHPNRQRDKVTALDLDF